MRGPQACAEEFILRSRWREGLHVDGRPARVQARIGHPLPVAGEYGVNGQRGTNAAEWRRFLVPDRVRPERPLFLLHDAEQHHVSVRMPGLRDVDFTGGRGRQSFGRAGPICGLPENAEIPLPHREKCDATAVRRPDGKTVPSSRRERLQRRGSPQVGYQHGCFLPVVGRDGEAVAVRGHARVLVQSGRKLQRFDAALLVDDDDVETASRSVMPGQGCKRVCRCWRHRTRQRRWNPGSIASLPRRSAWPFPLSRDAKGRTRLRGACHRSHRRDGRWEDTSRRWLL